MQWIIDRLKERSTWMGLTGLLGALGIGVSPELSNAIIAVGIASASLIAVITKDGSPSPNAKTRK